MKRTALALALTVAAAPAQGQIYGSHLSEWCDLFPEIAAGYVAGVVNGISHARAVADVEGSLRLCIPPHATMMQISRVACEYTQSHIDPDIILGASLIHTAIRVAYPCPD